MKLRHLLSFLSFPLVLGCSPGGGSDDENLMEASGGSGSSTGGGASGDSGGSGGTGTEGVGGGQSNGSGGATTTDEPLGGEFDFTVDIFSFPFAGGDASLKATASGMRSLDGCEVRRVGSCRSVHCPTIMIGESAALSAGDITASLTTDEGTSSATITQQPTGSYSTVDFAPSVTFLGMETGTVEATGGEDINAFSVNVTVPLLLVTAGAVGIDGVLSFSRSAGTTLTWDRGAPGVQYIVQQADVPLTEMGVRPCSARSIRKVVRARSIQWSLRCYRAEARSIR